VSGASVVGGVALAVHDDNGRLAGYEGAGPFDARRRGKPSQIGLAGARRQQPAGNRADQQATNQECDKAQQWKCSPGSLSLVAGARGSPDHCEMAWIGRRSPIRAERDLGREGGNLRLQFEAC
jgi:hypothetical protein